MLSLNPSLTYDESKENASSSGQPQHTQVQSITMKQFIDAAKHLDLFNLVKIRELAKHT